MDTLILVIAWWYGIGFVLATIELFRLWYKGFDVRVQDVINTLGWALMGPGLLLEYLDFFVEIINKLRFIRLFRGRKR
jgi:hypothetical protein